MKGGQRYYAIIVSLRWGLLAAVLAVSGIWIVNAVAPAWHWEHHPLHAVLEGGGATIALAVAWLLYVLRKFDALPEDYAWVSAALVAMGLLDGVHAVTHAGQQSLWLHSLAQSAGGVLVAACWLPWRPSGTAAAPATAAVFAALAVSVSVLFPGAMPVMMTSDGLTATAQALNIVGGLGFLAAALHFARGATAPESGHNVIFANHCLLFGASGLLFEQSQLWDPAWWLWHALRLAAYGLAAYYMFRQFYQVQVALASAHEALEAAVARETAALEAEVESRRASERAHKRAATQLRERARDLERLQLATLNIAEDANEERERANKTSAELQAANVELDQFAYVASHDLQAPLRAIQNLAKWIKEDAGDVLAADSMRHLETLLQRTTRMRSLLEDLLAYSRAGRKKGDLQPVDTRRTTLALIDLIGPPATITFEVADDLPVIRSFNAPFELVMRNLLSNAVKHMGRDSGRVAVSARNDGSMIAFKVEDNGPGIPADCRERVFELFQTLRPRDEVEGTGMGLAIVRKTVEAEGGWIEAGNSDLGGASFTFWWPCESRKESETDARASVHPAGRR